MSVQSSARVINIKASNLPKSVTLVFSFTAFGDVGQSVIWRANKFEADTTESYKVEYKPQFRFIYPIVKNNRIVGERAMRDLKLGQQTSLTSDGSTGTRQFTKPEEGKPDMLIAKNATPDSADLALGFPPEMPGQTNVALCNINVPSEGDMPVKWKPMLFAYAFVDRNYEENDLVREIGVGPIWERDLQKLDKKTDWFLVAKGDKFELVPALL